jgi:ATP-dependent DNA helicase DinG
MFNKGFFEYGVPRAILKFRQGFGRFIRSQKDRGVMLALDNRALQYCRMMRKKVPLAEILGKVKAWMEAAKM